MSLFPALEEVFLRPLISNDKELGDIQDRIQSLQRLSGGGEKEENEYGEQGEKVNKEPAEENVDKEEPGPTTTVLAETYEKGQRFNLEHGYAVFRRGNKVICDNKKWIVKSVTDHYCKLKLVGHPATIIRKHKSNIVHFSASTAKRQFDTLYHTEWK